MAYVPDCDEPAVKEVAQVYERIKIQQPISSSFTYYSSQVAQNLLREALRALNIALSVMNQQPASTTISVTKQIIKAAEAQLSSPRPAAAGGSRATTSTARRGKRRRSSVIEGKNSSSWVNLTAMPYEDGYEWRKYGEKKINGTTHTRSYFKCTYKDGTGCIATKHIQQKDNNDPPMFQVTYNNDHTCNCNTTTAKRNNSNNNLPLIFLGYFNREEGAINPPNNGVHTSIVKQEEPRQLLPPLLAEKLCRPSFGSNNVSRAT